MNEPLPAVLGGRVAAAWPAPLRQRLPALHRLRDLVTLLADWADPVLR